MARRGLLSVRWLVIAAAAAVTAVAAAAAAVNETPAAAVEAPVDPAAPCLGLASCHCREPGALQCQLSDEAELRAVAARLPGRPELQLADLVVRGLARLPGRLFGGAALHALLLSGSSADRLPADLLAGSLQHTLHALGLGEHRLAAVPTETLRPLTRLEQLDLSGNRLRSLPAGSLPPLARLTELNLADNALQEVSRGALAALPSLHTLWLEDNRLDVPHLCAGGLTAAAGLRRLTLDRNLLSGPLTARLAAALPPGVTELSLAANNLTSVSAGALAPLAALRSLDLSGNGIDLVSARAFSGLRRLRTLRLAGNRIVTLPAGGLAGLRGLVLLDLSGNALQALTEDVLSPLPALRRLLLRGNDLIQLDGRLLSALPDLKQLDLADNSLHCDCRMQALAAYLAARRASLDPASLSQATCATPLRLENAPLVDLTADLLTCDEPAPAEYPPLPAASPGDISLQSAQLTADGRGVRLLWRVDPSLAPYRCHQVSLPARPGSARSCDSAADPADPTALHVTLPAAGLAAGERRQFCLTLEQRPAVCHWTVLSAAPPALPQLDSLTAEVTGADRVTAWLRLSGQPAAGCAVSVLVLSAGGPLAALEVPCSQRSVTLAAAVGAGPVRVCSSEPYTAPLPLNGSRPLAQAAVAAADLPHRCVEVQPAGGGDLWWPAGAAALTALLAAGLLLGWALLRRRRGASCRADRGRRGRTRLQSDDSTASEDTDGPDSDADEETDLRV